MINVTKASLPDKQKLLGYIDKIYESAWLTNNGEFCQELEARLKHFLGVKNIILVANGTLALQIAYKALGLTGSVITTPFSFVATASSLTWEGLKPIFSDITADTWNLDPKKIASAIRPDTSAIVPVHVFGNPCEVEEIERIAVENRLKIVYDGAHAFDIKYRGESILNWGDATTLSFHATKLFHTIEGGAIITSDDELARKIRLLINFGITGPESIECVGINCKINEFQAVMGLCILDEFAKISRTRKQLWETYQRDLESVVTFQKWHAAASQNYHYLPVLFEDENQLKRVQNALNKESIVPRRYFYPSLDTLDFFSGSKVMAVSRDIAARILCLPISADLSIEEVARITGIIGENLAKSL